MVGLVEGEEVLGSKKLKRYLYPYDHSSGADDRCDASIDHQAPRRRVKYGQNEKEHRCTPSRDFIYHSRNGLNP